MTDYARLQKALEEQGVTGIADIRVFTDPTLSARFGALKTKDEQFRWLWQIPEDEYEPICRILTSWVKEEGVGSEVVFPTSDFFFEVDQMHASVAQGGVTIGAAIEEYGDTFAYRFAQHLIEHGIGAVDDLMLFTTPDPQNRLVSIGVSWGTVSYEDHLHNDDEIGAAIVKAAQAVIAEMELPPQLGLVLIATAVQNTQLEFFHFKP